MNSAQFHEKFPLLRGLKLMFNPKSYLRILISQLQNPRFHLPISHIHNPASNIPSRYNPAIQFALDEAQQYQSSKTRFSSPSQEEKDEVFPQQKHGSRIQISHPWREWVDLMEKLLKNGYFDEIGNPFARNGDLGSKEANLIRTACLNFARDQFQLIRYLSRKDILVIAESGCPSTDRKVVNSGKRLRAHAGVNEGNVCSSCILRGDCDRAYVKAREDDGGRTVDVMRFLLTYGLDPVISCVENKPCLNKRVKESVRTLLKEMVDIRVGGEDHESPKATIHECAPSTQENDVEQVRSQFKAPMKQGDWICPKCNFLNFARNVKCLRCDGLFEERIKKLAEEQENLPLKKGDWICEKCKFLNFARNTRCLQCKEKPPKRQLNPGEWECDSCNYINFRRNMVCLKCDHKRPIASNGAEIASPPMRQSMHTGEGSMRFVYKSESERWDQGRSISRDQVRGFVDFPVLGGKTELSQDAEKREMWKMEMADKCRSRVLATEDNWAMYRRKSDFLASGDDNDDDMAEWFEGRKSHDNGC